MVNCCELEEPTATLPKFSAAGVRAKVGATAPNAGEAAEISIIAKASTGNLPPTAPPWRVLATSQNSNTGNKKGNKVRASTEKWRMATGFVSGLGFSRATGR
jgi:hypothetical protein